MPLTKSVLGVNRNSPRARPSAACPVKSKLPASRLSVNLIGPLARRSARAGTSCSGIPMPLLLPSCWSWIEIHRSLLLRVQ
jgi:hypothetical protein